MEQYTLVFLPDAKGIDLVKEMKIELSKKIGWFGSKNAMAHITICGFKATEEELPSIENKIKTICFSLSPAEVNFNSFDSFPSSRAFFIAPAPLSREILASIMKVFHDQLGISYLFKSEEPHISIARNLDKNKLAITHQLFKEVDLNFLCDGVYLRRFNPKLGQYEVIDKFEFGGLIH